MTYPTGGVGGRDANGRFNNRFKDESRFERSTEEGLVDTIRDNPISVALIGAGLGLLIAGTINASRSQEDDYDYNYYPTTRPSSGSGSYTSPYSTGASYGRYGESYGTGSAGSRYTSGDASTYGSSRASGGLGSSAGYAGSSMNQGSTQSARDNLQSARDNLRNQASQVGEGAREGADRARERARYGARRAQRGLGRALDENPLAVGAVAALAGAAVGLLIPSTDYENEFMGDTRDTVMSRAQDLAKEAQGAAKHVVQDALNTAKEEAQKQGLTAQGLREDLQDKVEKGKQVAQKAAEEAKQTAKQEAQGSKEEARSAAEDVKESAKEDANKAQDKAQQAAKNATSGGQQEPKQGAEQLKGTTLQRVSPEKCRGGSALFIDCFHTQIVGNTLICNILTQNRDEHALSRMMPAEKCGKLTWNR